MKRTESDTISIGLSKSSLGPSVSKTIKRSLYTISINLMNTFLGQFIKTVITLSNSHDIEMNGDENLSFGLCFGMESSTQCSDNHEMY